MSMIIDGTNGLTFNNATTQASAGQVLQIVNATYSTQVTSTTTTPVDTGLTATITPKFSTSKILVIVNQNSPGTSGSDQAGIYLNILRTSTVINTIAVNGLYNPAAAGASVNGSTLSNTYLDSPTTTSATTYKTQVYNANAPTAGTVYVQRGGATSTITLMEIAG
jgi:hypothetical protein